MVSLRSPKFTLIKGALWAVGTRWSIKAIGFFNTVIMARLLLPADYGVVAMSMLVVGLIQAFMDTGVGAALLRKEDLAQDEIDSAWTLRLMQSMAVGVALLAISPVVANYFEESRVQAILWVLALCIVLEGAGNIGLTLAQKSFNFALEFRVNVIAKTVSVLATFLAGYFLRDYRALVIGIVVGYCTTFVLSYSLHAYRPRWNTSRIHDIWAVTKWLLLSSIGTFLIRRSDELIAARVGTTEEYGVYYVGADLGRLPVGELGPSLMRAFLPVLSSIKADVRRTNLAVLKALAAANALTLPMGFGMAAVALPLTLLILGDKWQQAAPFVAGFALVASAQFAISPLNTLLVLHGHTRTQSIVVGVELVVFIGAAYFLLPRMHLMGLVWSRLLAMAASALVTIAYTQKLCGLPWGAVLKVFVRPLVGSVAMYLLVRHTTSLFSTDWTQLAAGIAAGVATYAGWLMLSWWMAGKPEGLESSLVDAIHAIRKKRG